MLAGVLWAQVPAVKAAEQAAPGAADPVVLTVGGTSITRSQFEQLVASLPQQSRQEASTPAGRRQLANRLAELESLAQEARKRGLAQRPAVQQQIRLSEDNVLANALFTELLAAAKPTEEQARQYYDQHKSDFEEAKARHILVRIKGSRVPLRSGQTDLTETEALAKAEQLRQRILGGESFEAVAKAESDDAGTAQAGGDLGAVNRGRTVRVFEDAVFSQKVGEVGPPVKSEFGYHLIRVDERGAKPFEAVRATIESREAPEQARREVQAISNSTPKTLDEGFFGPTVPETKKP
jgi:peptidyl-prolyl cis-trans isomerase C